MAQLSKAQQPRIIPNYKPPRRLALLDRVFQPCTILQRGDRFAIAFALLALGGLIGLKQAENTQLQQQIEARTTNAAHPTQKNRNNTEQPYRPARFDLYEPLGPLDTQSL